MGAGGSGVRKPSMRCANGSACLYKNGLRNYLQQRKYTDTLLYKKIEKNEKT
jgi:hypothetical protein